MYRTSRFDLEEAGTFWCSETPEQTGSIAWGAKLPRICTGARLTDRDSGRAFYIYNVHFDHESQASREGSAVLLLQRIASRDHRDPVIVTGDFNAGEGNPAMLYIVGLGEPPPPVNLRDTFRAVEPDASEVGTFNGFVGTTSGEKIDAVLASDGWATEAAAIVRTSRDGRYPSDHFPVVAVVAFLGS
jgi:endonuclease/exonuclease/phosphatase family metal-dependent hydrolase